MAVTLLRTLILYIVIMVAMRIMGKRQVGDMQPSDLVVSLLISEIAAMPIDNIDRPIVNGIIAVFLLVFLETALACISLKSGKLRRVVNGAPVIIINRGKVNRASLKRLRITTDELLETLRSQGVFDISTVQYAIIEPNGQLSVLEKSGGSLAVPVICDGKMQTHFMESAGISKHEVNSALKKRGISAEDVFIMTLDGDGKAFIIKEDGKS
ncbi:MAG: DUF421 domain-containing protein [Clostridia bacterium]|nr:DUF421 domain-containing protein [Clostridia bacterium]MBQ5902329.1 DUF421 domain-containing protein [Clostridia bacterium]